MRKIIPFYILLFAVFFILNQTVTAENIHFNDDVYDLKYSETTSKDKIIENEYYKVKENRSFWTSMVGIYYNPEVSNPLKYASDVDKKIETSENLILLKFMQNKKQDVAVISYLENVVQDNGTYFIYNIYKYEKHPKKGMMILRFAKKYAFNNKEEITKIGEEVRAINNDYMEKLIYSPIPPIVVKHIP